MSDRDGPRRVEDALRHVRRELGAPEPGHFTEIRDSWVELVGASLAAHSSPVNLRGGVLRISVDDPAWASQFRYLADGLVEALTERVTGAAVREISVVVGRSQTGGTAGADPAQ